MQKRNEEFFKQAMIAAMQAMIQARAITEAAQSRDQHATVLSGGKAHESPVDSELFTHSVYSGVGAPVAMLDEDNEHYSWGALIAEEAYEIAMCMVDELEIGGL